MTDQPHPPLRPQRPVRPRRRRTQWSTIIAVALLAALMSILAVALLGGRSGDGTSRESDAPNAEPSGSPSAAVTSALPSGSSNPGASASTAPTARFSPDEIVATAVEALSIRYTAGLDGDVLWQLPNETLGLVIGGPVEADGLAWYQVSGMGLPYGSGCVTPEPGEVLDCPFWLGWLAEAAPDGTAYLAPATAPACPDPPYTMVGVSEQQSTLRLICFDAEPLTFRAWWPSRPYDAGLGSDCPAAETDLGWLVCQNRNHNGLAADPSEPGGRLVVTVDPASGVEMPARDQWIEVTGHFDDPAARRCGAVADAMSSDPGTLVFECRLQFVLSAAAPTAAP